LVRSTSSLPLAAPPFHASEALRGARQQLKDAVRLGLRLGRGASKARLANPGDEHRHLGARRSFELVGDLQADLDVA
jgi:hypothetical protein